MQTSQDLHARKELDHLLQLVPHEAAGWANLGLLLLRQQQVDEAATPAGQGLRARAAECAPSSDCSRRPRAERATFKESVRHWRRAIELDAADLKAPYALAQELERIGGVGERRGGAAAVRVDCDAIGKPHRQARIRACCGKKKQTRSPLPKGSMRWRRIPRPGPPRRTRSFGESVNA